MASPVLIITHIYRYVTSLVASFLQALGVKVENKLFPANDFNRTGYLPNKLIKIN